MIFAGILAMVLLAIVCGFFLLGWVIPLVIVSKCRRENNPGFKAWNIFAAAWGILAIVCAVGVGVLVFVVSGEGRRYGVSPGKSSDFSMSKYKGTTGRLMIPFQGEAQVSAQCGKLGSISCSASNGMFILPSGVVAVNSFCAIARDKSDRKWTANGRWNYRGAFATNSWEVPAGGMLALKIGPPFRASIEVTYSPVNGQIRMEPQYVDAYGNQYSISCDKRTGTEPKFEVFDSDNKLVMSGKFEFG